LSTLVGQLYLFTEVTSDDDYDFFSYLKLQDISSLSPVAMQLDNYLSSASTSVEYLVSCDVTCDECFHQN